MTRKNTLVLIICILVLGALAVIFFQSKRESVVSIKYDSFAQCLASRNLTMYGAVWCSHCRAQKALFRESFKYVLYVECTETPDLCVAKGVTGYPTWIDQNGAKYTGEQSLEKLSQISNCELPAQ